jgi:hypothetical protein
MGGPVNGAEVPTMRTVLGWLSNSVVFISNSISAVEYDIGW